MADEDKRAEETLTPNLLNLRWARNVANNNPHSSGSFVRSIAIAACSADDANLDILQFSLTAFRKKYPTWDIEEAKS